MISLMLSFNDIIRSCCFIDDIIDAVIQWYHWRYACTQWYHCYCHSIMSFNAFMMLTFNDIIDAIIQCYHWCCHSMILLTLCCSLMISSDVFIQSYHWCCHAMISLMLSYYDIIGCCHSMISLMQSHNHCKGYYSRILWDIVIDAKIQWYHGTMISLMLSYHDIIDAIIQWYH